MQSLLCPLGMLESDLYLASPENYVDTGFGENRIAELAHLKCISRVLKRFL